MDRTEQQDSRAFYRLGFRSIQRCIIRVVVLQGLRVLERLKKGFDVSFKMLY